MSKIENFGEQIRERREHAYKLATGAGIGLTRSEASALAGNEILKDQMREELARGERPVEEVLSDSDRNKQIGRIIDSPVYQSARIKISKFAGLVMERSTQ